MRILIVEDDQSHSALLQRMLKRLGFQEITETGSGAEALRYLRSRPFDLILTDCKLPQIDGLDVVRRFRTMETSRRTPIILITTFSDAETVQRAVAAGVDAYIVKPPTLETLRAKIAGVMHKKRAQGGAAMGQSM